MTKPKRSDLSNAKTNSETDFLTFGAKKAFIHLQKALIKAPILRHYNPEYYIWIETDALGYTIGEILSQIILHHLDPPFSNYMTNKNLDPIFSKSEIGQWQPVAIFSQKIIPVET